MTQATAPMSAAIKFITGLVLVMTVALLIAGLKVCGFLLGGRSWGPSSVSAIFLPPLLMSSATIS